MARVSLTDDVLGEPDEPRRPQPVPPVVPPDTEPDRYKLTVMLEEDEHETLEALTDAVVRALAPKRVGKGWRTKVIRSLLALAESDPTAVQRIVDDIRSRQG